MIARSLLALLTSLFAASGLGLPATSGAGGVPVPTVTGPAVASGPHVPPGAQTGRPQLELLGQSVDVESGQSWQLHLAVRAPAPSSDQVRLYVYDRLTTRIGFDETLHGQALGSWIWRSAAEPLSTVPEDSGGGVTLSIPLDIDLPGIAYRGQSGIYPVQVQLLDQGFAKLSTLTTYLVFVAGTPAQTGFPKLDVSLTLPVHAPPVLPAPGTPAPDATAASIARSAGELPPAAVAAFGSEVAALRRHPGVPLTLAVTPQTADMLEAAAGGRAGGRAGGASSSLVVAVPSVPGGGGKAESRTARVVLDGLSDLVAGGDELVPGTYVDTSIGAMKAAGLSSELSEQLAAGAASLRADLDHAPETATWVVDGPLDAVTAQVLVEHGATKLVVPAADLRQLPKSGLQFTVAVPAELPVGPSDLAVDAADPQLAAHFVSTGDQVLAANQLLAELAMIQLETPSRVRGVAILPPVGWPASAAFLDALLAGLNANPLLQPVTADRLFSDVPVGTASRSKVVRALVHQQAPAPLAGAATVEQARLVASGYAAVLPQASATAAELDRRVLIAESSDLSSAQRSEVLGSVVAAAVPIERGISLPGGTSITLTARKGKLPLTILDHPGLRVHVELRLSSDKLTFEPFAPAGGSCAQTSESSESCDLALSTAVTTVKVPVEARTSGVFTLNVSVLSPDGSLLFASNRDTVRSTAVSGVGVILIVLATLGLAYWWFRNIRFGRRARQLIAVGEAPGDGDPAAEAGEGDRGDGGAGTGTGGSGVDELDRLAEFFASPAPQYPLRSAPALGVASPDPGTRAGPALPGATPVSPSGGGSSRRG